MNREGVMVYPLDSEFMPVLRQQNNIAGHVISHLVSPKGWGHAGEDAGNIDRGSSVGLIVRSDFDEVLKECSTVVFVDTNTRVDFEKNIYPKMVKVAECSKNIICMRHLEAEHQKEIEDICRKNKSVFQYCFQKETTELYHPPAFEHIYNIEVPVVFVLGISERTDKFSLQLALRENLMEQGYAVSQVGSRSYCEILGFHSFPSFMYSTSLHEYEKIILFNHYIKNVEMKENPDVIIIGIPGAIMPMDQHMTDKFGIFAFMISQAVKPDFSVLSVFANLAAADFFELVSETSKYRLGFEIDCFNLTNTAFDWRNLKKDIARTGSYVTLDQDLMNDIRKKVESSRMPVYSIKDVQDALEMTEFMIHKLHGYTNSQAV